MSSEDTVIDFLLDHTDVDGFDELLLNNPDIVEIVASDKRLTSELIEKIIDSEPPSRVVAKLSLNPATPERVLRKLTDKALTLDYHNSDMSAIFLNPLMPEDCLRASVNLYPFQVAKNPSTPEEVVRVLYKRLHRSDVYHLTQNPNLPHDISWEIYREHIPTSPAVEFLIQKTKHVDIMLDAIRSHKMHTQSLKLILNNPVFTKVELFKVLDYFGENMYRDISDVHSQDEEVLFRLLKDCSPVHPHTRSIVLGYISRLPAYANYPAEWLDEMFPKEMES